MANISRILDVGIILTKLYFCTFSVDPAAVATAAKMHLFGNGDNVAAAVAAYSTSSSTASNSIHSNVAGNEMGRVLTANANGSGQGQHNNSGTVANSATAESIMELSTKMLQAQQQHQFNSSQNSQGSLSATGSSASAMFPPKSQIKRQKMIYHCKVSAGVAQGDILEFGY